LTNSYFVGYLLSFYLILAQGRARICKCGISGATFINNYTFNSCLFQKLSKLFHLFRLIKIIGFNVCANVISSSLQHTRDSPNHAFDVGYLFSLHNFVRFWWDWAPCLPLANILSDLTRQPCPSASPPMV